MNPLYILPPTRRLRAFAVNGKKAGARSPYGRTAEDAAAMIAAYDEVRRRDKGTCQDCQRQNLTAPALRLWVKDRTKPLCAAHNLALLCPRCCRDREAACCM